MNVSRWKRISLSDCLACRMPPFQPSKLDGPVFWYGILRGVAKHMAACMKDVSAREAFSSCVDQPGNSEVAWLVHWYAEGRVCDQGAILERCAMGQGVVQVGVGFVFRDYDASKALTFLGKPVRQCFVGPSELPERPRRVLAYLSRSKQRLRQMDLASVPTD